MDLEAVDAAHGAVEPLSGHAAATSAPAELARIRVLIAEDETSVREALSDLISSEDSMEVVAMAKDAEEAIQLARAERPEVALVDVKMPAGGGPRAARGIREESPETHVVALSAYDDKRTVLEMLQAGVVGYVVKGTSADEILRTIQRTARGQGSLSVEITADVIHELAALLDRSETLNKELQDLNRTKSELIQILSHELFTPITTIQAFAGALSANGTALRPEEASEMTEGVSRASHRIRRLIGNLSAASRLDREGVEVSTRPIHARELLETAVSEFPNRDRLRLPKDLARLDDRLWADSQLAVRALVTVLENALALSPDDSSVEIGICTTGGSLEFAIADHGPGVADDAKDRVFDAFVQADASNTRPHEGLGIGLYLARRILRAHGGKITVTDRPGGGSVFTLSFPAFEGLGTT